MFRNKRPLSHCSVVGEQLMNERLFLGGRLILDLQQPVDLAFKKAYDGVELHGVFTL